MRRLGNVARLTDCTLTVCDLRLHGRVHVSHVLCLEQELNGNITNETKKKM